MNLPSWVPQNPPKYVRIIIYITLGFFTLIGLGLSIHMLDVSFFSFVVHSLYFILLGVIASAILLFAFEFFSKTARKSTEEHMMLQYQQQGMCMDMAETIKAIMPAPTDRDLVLRAFILTMSEHFKEAELQISRINQKALSKREFSMLMTSKIRTLMMTGGMEKAGKLIEMYQGEMNTAYDNKPDYFNEYRAYADDTFEFYMLAAVYYELIRDPETAVKYRKKAEFQVSSRSTSELEYYRQLMELNRLYITGKNQEAHVLENEMRGMAEHFDPPLPQGIKNDLLRAAEQAKVFASAHTLINTEIMQERQLPQHGGEALPADLIGM